MRNGAFSSVAAMIAPLSSPATFRLLVAVMIISVAALFALYAINRQHKIAAGAPREARLTPLLVGAYVLTGISLTITLTLWLGRH
jgi:hypothetical protein